MKTVLVEIGTEVFKQVFHQHEGRQNKAAANYCLDDNKATGRLDGCDAVWNLAQMPWPLTPYMPSSFLTQPSAHDRRYPNMLKSMVTETNVIFSWKCNKLYKNTENINDKYKNE